MFSVIRDYYVSGGPRHRRTLAVSFDSKRSGPWSAPLVVEGSEGSDLGPQAVEEIIEGRYKGGDTLVLKDLGHIIKVDASGGQVAEYGVGGRWVGRHRPCPGAVV